MTFTNSEKTLARSYVGTLAALVLDNLYVDFLIDNHVYIHIIHTYMYILVYIIYIYIYI